MAVPTRKSTSVEIVTVVFYVGFAMLLGLIMLDFVPDVGPKIVVEHVSSNSESYLVALILCGWIQFGCWRLRGRDLVLTAVVLSACLALVGVFLYLSDLPAPVKTLNESCIACAFLIPWSALPGRPWSRRWSWLPALLLAVAAGLCVAVGVTIVVHLAEALVAAVAIMVALDFWDRGLAVGRLLGGWLYRSSLYLMLIAVPLAVVLAGVARRTDGGFVNGVLHYLGRGQEGFVAALLICGFLAGIVALRQRSVWLADIRDDRDVEPVPSID